MAKGQPDFGALAPTETIVGISDLGELAVRLGSIVSFDRRGNVVWFDDFEDGIGKWAVVPNGTGAGAEWVAGIARSKGFSVKLTTGNTIGDSVGFRRSFPKAATSKIGFEASFTVLANIDFISFELYFYDGTKYYRPVLYIDVANDQLTYLADDLTTHVIEDNLGLIKSPYMVYTIKLVVDMNALVYVRALFRDKDHDLAGKGIFSGFSGTGPSFVAHIEPFTAVNNNISIYLDDVILTQNEP